MSIRNLSVLVPLSILAACVAPPPPPPPPAPPPVPASPPPRAPVVDWRDAPLTPGTWTLSSDAAGTSASYGVAGAAAELILRCDLASRMVSLGWQGAVPAGGNRGTITTSYGATGFSSFSGPGLPAGYTGTARGASDPLLDQIAFSRGRWMLSLGDGARYIVPSWAEIARAVEDCRK